MITKRDFVTVINHYVRENNKVDAIDFLQKLEIPSEMIPIFINKYWNRLNPGGSIWTACLQKEIKVNLALKKLVITYKIVESSAPYEFERPEKQNP